jgi:hypothetical protein
MPFHNAGVKFDIPIAGEAGSSARVEHRIIFERTYRCFDCIKRGATRLQDAPSN